MPILGENPQTVLTATFLPTDSPSAGAAWAVSVLLPVFFTVPSQVAVGCSYSQVSITEVQSQGEMPTVLTPSLNLLISSC